MREDNYALLNFQLIRTISCSEFPLERCGEFHGLWLAIAVQFPNRSEMGLPQQAVTLSPEQIKELNDKLSKMRHDLNNNLAMILAAAELAKLKPDMAAKMLDRLIEQPGKMTAQIKEFSSEFEKTFGITRP